MANSQVAEKEKLDAQTNNQDSVATIVTTENNKKNTIPDSEKKIVYSNQNLDICYGENHALQNINLYIMENNLSRI